jgi:hypothetical protein
VKTALVETVRDEIFCLGFVNKGEEADPEVRAIQAIGFLVGVAQPWGIGHTFKQFLGRSGRRWHWKLLL